MVRIYEKADPKAPANGKPFSCPGCGAEYKVHDADAVPGAVLQFDFECSAKGCKAGVGGKAYKAGVGLA